MKKSKIDFNNIIEIEDVELLNNNNNKSNNNKSNNNEFDINKRKKVSLIISLVTLFIYITTIIVMNTEMIIISFILSIITVISFIWSKNYYNSIYWIINALIYLSILIFN